MAFEQAKADSSAESKVYVHRKRDRRMEATSVGFPLLDSDFNIVRKDRRSTSDRRKANLKLIWQENQPIRNTSSLALNFNQQKYYFDKGLQEFSLGRSKESDLQIEGRFVSKKHATIKYENGEFVLEDSSLNGTYIVTEDLGKIRIQDQKVYLFGNGTICLGKPIDRNEAHAIHFQCD